MDATGIGLLLIGGAVFVAVGATKGKEIARWFGGLPVHLKAGRIAAERELAEEEKALKAAADGLNPH